MILSSPLPPAYVASVHPAAHASLEYLLSLNPFLGSRALPLAEDELYQALLPVRILQGFSCALKETSVLRVFSFH